MRQFVLAAVIAFGAMIGIASADTLVAFGVPDRQDTNRPNIGLLETYSLICDQSEGTCTDNFSHGGTFFNGAFGDSGPALEVGLCGPEKDTTVSYCVNSIELTVITSEPYMDVTAHIQRSGCEENVMYFDGTRLGGNASSGLADATTAGEEEHYIDVSYGVGMITPRKEHTLLITMPLSQHCGKDNQFNIITWLSLTGTPISMK